MSTKGGSADRARVIVETLRAGIDRAAVAYPKPLDTVNCYLLTNGKAAVLVDTAAAPGEAIDHVGLLLAHAGIRPQEVTSIVLTHCHRDHSDGAVALQQLTGAPVVMHQAERFTLAEADERSRDNSALSGWMVSHGVSPAMAEEMAGAFRWTSPEPGIERELVEDGHEIAVGSSRWRVVHTPGHTPGHLCLYEPLGGVLVTGDHVLPNESSNISVRPNQPYDPLGAYLLALERVLALRPELCLPGHGEPFGDPSEVIGRQFKHHAARLDDVRGALSDGARTGLEVASEIPWVQRSKRLADLDGRHRFLAFGETLAHLECLEARGEVIRQGSGPIVWRRAT
ncbi:MAG: MBL fold metallo-hydrolase [Candidatus Acidiferrales bacterium]